LKPIALSLFIALTITSVSAGSPVDWVVGDVVVAAGNGSYQVWHSGNPNASKPSYTKLVTLNDGVTPTGGGTAGCTFDSAYRLFTTNVTNSKVIRFSIDAGHGPISDIAAATLRQNESVAFDGQGNFYVGYAGTNTSTAGLAKYSHNGAQQHLFSPPTVALENSGVDWIDLASDGQTVFYTSEGRKIFTFNTAAPTTPSSVYADLSTLHGAGTSGKLFAIRILPAGDGSGGVLVADQTNVKLVKASGGVITSVQVFKFKNESNLQALSLDPANPARFWVGDASTNDLIQFDMSTGSTVVTLNTGTGTNLGGVCVDGGFSAAQNFAPPARGTQTFPVTPASNTISFTSPFTGAILTATLANLQKPVTVTIHDSLVDPSVGASDPTVLSFNPGNGTAVTSFAGPLPCNQALTALALIPNACEVFEFEANPALETSIISNVEVCPPSGCGTILDIANSNPRLLRNLNEDITDGINTYPLSGTRSNCVYTVNDQTFTAGAHSCGFQSPSKGQAFTKSQGSSLPFKFVAVGNGGTCPPSTSGALGAGAIMPLLMITQLVPPDAPVSDTVIVKGNSGGFPIFTFSGNTWQLQVDSSNLPRGNYLATVIDLFNVIPAFGVNFTLQ
jgi:hypothetical protein